MTLKHRIALILNWTTFAVLSCAMITVAAKADTPCLTEIGASQAKVLVAQCLQVSAATRPPCNVQNSCALIKSEIQRSCDMLKSGGGSLPAFCPPQPAKLQPSAQSQIVDPNTEIYSFKSPSGNIMCIYVPSMETRPASFRCDIMNFVPSIRVVPPEANENAEALGECTPKAMSAFEIQAGASKTATFCPTDAPISGEQFVLPYGAVLRRGGMTCTSATSGMSCVNELGHGFSLSKAEQKLF